MLNSTTLRTFTSHHLPTDRIGQHLTIPYVACSHSYSPTDHNRQKHIKPSLNTTRSTLQTLRTFYLTISRLNRSALDHTIRTIVRLLFSDRPLDNLEHVKPSTSTVLPVPLYNNIDLISLSPDWPYQSHLTIPYVACSQTHILRPTILTADIKLSCQ